MGHRVNVWGTPMHFLKEGSGPPLILVHGIASGSGAWRYNIPDLARRFTVYAPDLPGWADSPPLADRAMTMETAAELLPAFLDAVGLDAAPAAGWSMGGAVVMAAALHAPDRFPKLVLVGSAGLGPELHWSFRLAGVPLLGDWLSRPSRAGIERGLRQFYAHRADRLTDDYKDYLLDIARRPYHRRSTLQTLRRYQVVTRGQRLVDLSSRLGELPMPVLVVWGDRDKIFPVAHAERAVARLRAGALRILPDCGHMAPAEDPESFNRHVAEFLS